MFLKSKIKGMDPQKGLYPFWGDSAFIQGTFLFHVIIISLQIEKYIIWKQII